MKQIPKYSKELIEMLDLEVQPPVLPTSPKSWAGLNEAELRRGAFMAGRRSVIDELVDALEEDNETDSGASEGGPSAMGYDGISYPGLAPTHLARGYPENQDYPIRRPDEFDFGD